MAQALATLGAVRPSASCSSPAPICPGIFRPYTTAGLAVRVREGLKLAESRTVAHLHNLARALTRPQDEVAWAAVLRGPWGPQPLATLARVAQISGGSVAREIAPLCGGPDDCPADLPGLAESLKTARGQVGRRPLADILTDWLGATSAWAGIAAWEGPLGVANARTYLDLLAAAEAGLPEATFVKADFNLQEAFQPPDPRAQASPVEILTVHGAKGLEFHQVFLPFLDWQPLKSEDNTPPFLLEEIPGRDVHGLALARPYVQEKQSSLYLLLRDLKNQRVVDEARRVFYVAVTRARQRLVMSGLARLDKTGELAGLRRQSPGVAPRALPARPAAGGVCRKLARAGNARGTVNGSAAPDRRDRQSPGIACRLGLSPGSRALPGKFSLPAWRLPRTKRPPGRKPNRRRSATQPGSGGWSCTGPFRPWPGVTRAGCGVPGRRPAAGGDDRPGGRSPGGGNSGGTRGLPGGPVPYSLLAPDIPGAASEWLLEDQPQPGAIRRGVIDHLAFDGQDWWLLDFKPPAPPPGRTGKPSSPRRPRSTAPNSWPTGRWRPRPGVAAGGYPGGNLFHRLPAVGGGVTRRIVGAQEGGQTPLRPDD